MTRARKPTSTLDRVRQRLRQKYLSSLPAKLAVFEQSLTELRRKHEVADALETARRLAHQLRGSGASFGFPELGFHAGRVEDAPDEGIIAPLERLVDELRSSVLSESSPHTSILIVDDDPSVTEMIAGLISEPRRKLYLAGSCAEAREILGSTELDLLILDLILPDGDGRDLLTEIRERSQTQSLAVVVLSAKTGALVKNECAIYGVESYIEKPIVDQSLRSIVATVLERKREFVREALHDDLTRLNNRSGFRGLFSQMAAIGRRRDAPLSLALIDIDRFKALNDTYGHETGDMALVALAELMTATLRRSDVVGRWGGEEFVVALPDTGVAAACIAIRKLAAAAREMEISPTCTETLTFSAGVVKLEVDESLDLALLRADQLLYHAKRAGRDRVVHVADDPIEGVRLLIVEDDADVAGLLLDALRDRYVMTHCSDAASALTATETETFDLVLLDFHLPDGTGLDILTRLRARPAYAKVPILILTGMASDEAVESAFAAGADDYIVKPVSPRALRSRIERRLARA